MMAIDDATVNGIIARARFDVNGLLPVVVQQYDSREVLMLGYMDAEALRRTMTQGRVTYWSRSRQQ
jgi:phosphoribosyl-AMP cyclohydrolase